MGSTLAVTLPSLIFIFSKCTLQIFLLILDLPLMIKVLLSTAYPTLTDNKTTITKRIYLLYKLYIYYYNNLNDDSD